MDTELIIWCLNTFGRDRGYDLTKEELREFVPHSDFTMKRRFIQWQKEQRRGED